MIKLLGLIGGLCFAYCGVPIAYQTWRAGKSLGTPISTAWMIFVGAVMMYTYLTASYGFDGILMLNYTVEGLSWAVVVRYHYL